MPDDTPAMTRLEFSCTAAGIAQVADKWAGDVIGKGRKAHDQMPRETALKSIADVQERLGWIDLGCQGG